MNNLTQIYTIPCILQYCFSKILLATINNPMYSHPYQQPYPPAPMHQKPIPAPITSLTVKNPLVSQLKTLLEEKLRKGQQSIQTEKHPSQQKRQQKSVVPYPLTKEKIFTAPAKAYFILNSLFQTFKKKNEFRLLQQKVHKIQVYHHQQSPQQQAKLQESNTLQFTQSIKPTKPSLKVQVTPLMIFSSHESELTGKEIEKFIQIQAYIRPEMKNDLIDEILKSISNLTQIKDIMKCFQKLFTTRYCQASAELRELVEEKMIKKILSIDFAFQQTPNPFHQIAYSLLGFPKLTPNILYFIGLLFDKVSPTHLQSYDLLYQIMKRNFSFKLDNLQEAVMNVKNKKEIEALIKISTKENIQLIKGLLRAYGKVKERVGDSEEGQVVNVVKIAEIEAHYKLVQLAAFEEQQAAAAQLLIQQAAQLAIQQSLLQPSAQQSTQQPPIPLPIIKQQAPLPQIPLPQQQPPQQQPPISPKTQYILKFISQVIKSGSNIWTQVNQWLKSTQLNNSKTFLLTQISTYLERCFNDEKKLKNYVLPHIRIIGKDLAETSQVYKLWLGQLLKPTTEKTVIKEKYLKFTLVKKFIIKGVINSMNMPLFVSDLFHPSLLHAELLYDIFTLQKDRVFAFYKEILENQNYSKHFFVFLTALKDKNPVKLKEWLISADQTRGGQLFLCSRSILIEFMKTHMKIELAFNMIRDFALHPPSKFLVWILISLISVYKQKKDLYPPLRTCIAKTINLILIRTPVNKLCDQFKKHLPSLAHEFQDSKQDYQMIFADVSAETLAELKRAHKESQGIKF